MSGVSKKELSVVMEANRTISKAYENLLVENEALRMELNNLWTDVKDKLPPPPYDYYEEHCCYPEYIVMIQGAIRPTVLCFYGDLFVDENTGCSYPITHWRPMVSSPIKEEAND